MEKNWRTIDGIARRYKKFPHELMELELDQFLFDLFVYEKVEEQAEKDRVMQAAQNKLNEMERGG